jgi:hypothetical protein
MLESIIYVVFCLLTGICGIDRRLGFFGTFVLALVTTSNGAAAFSAIA